jgi:hypothetical protein
MTTEKTRLESCCPAIRAERLLKDIHTFRKRVARLLYKSEYSYSYGAEPSDLPSLREPTRRQTPKVATLAIWLVSASWHRIASSLACHCTPELEPNNPYPVAAASRFLTQSGPHLRHRAGVLSRIAAGCVLRLCPIPATTIAVVDLFYRYYIVEEAVH